MANTITMTENETGKPAFVLRVSEVAFATLDGADVVIYLKGISKPLRLEGAPMELLAKIAEGMKSE